MIRRLALTTSVLALCVSGAFAQDKIGRLTDPIEILKRADAASRVVSVAQYEAKAFAHNAGKKARPIGAGKVVIQGFNVRGPEKFKISGKFRMPDSEDPHHFTTGSSEDDQHLTIGSDAKVFYLIDWKTKQAYVDFDPDVTGPRGQLGQAIIMAEYVHPTPFSDELNGTEQRLVGTAMVGDEECYEVVVHTDMRGWQHAPVSQVAHWFFSTKDFLPRRVDRLFTREGQPRGGTSLIVTSLSLDPENAEKLFKFNLPDGFERIDDFAP